MNYVQTLSAEKELFPCAFLFFFEETNDVEMNYKRITGLAEKNRVIDYKYEVSKNAMTLLNRFSL